MWRPAVRSWRFWCSSSACTASPASRRTARRTTSTSTRAERRARVERLFGGFTNLERVAGVDGHNKRAVLDVLSGTTALRVHFRTASTRAPSGFGAGRAPTSRDSGARCLTSKPSSARTTTGRYALILEDDATPDLVPTWAGSLSDFVETLPEDWTIVQLGVVVRGQAYGPVPRGRRRGGTNARHDALPKRGSLIWSAQAYLVSREG